VLVREAECCINEHMRAKALSPRNDGGEAGDSRLLRTSEVARRLGVCQQTVRRWVHAGQLPAVRLTKYTVRIKSVDLDAFLNTGATAES
jgi:excisionase family DNA binding protein